MINMDNRICFNKPCYSKHYTKHIDSHFENNDSCIELKVPKLRKKITKKSRLIIPNYDINNSLELIGKQWNLPIEIQNKILNFSINKMNNKLKTELTVFFPRLKKIQEDICCLQEIKAFTTKLFLKLPHKYKKAYILALEDIDSILFSELLGLIFLSRYWHEIVRYIGNRNEAVSSDVYEFIVYYYGELAIPLPSQVKFRDIINSIFLYFDAMSGLINTNTTLLDIENIDQNYFF
tara:strand:- start:4312 stop:5016 length:705 start_codon:yes stop_codon:yes gene_type:complete